VDEPLGIAIPANDFLRINWPQNFLHTLEKDGSLGMIVDRWFKDGSWVKQLRQARLRLFHTFKNPQ